MGLLRKQKKINFLQSWPNSVAIIRNPILLEEISISSDSYMKKIKLVMSTDTLTHLMQSLLHMN